MKQHLKMTLAIEVEAPTEKVVAELGKRLAMKLPYMITDNENYLLTEKNLQYEFIDF